MRNTQLHSVSRSQDLLIKTPASAAPAEEPVQGAFFAAKVPVLQHFRAAGLRPTIARIGIYQAIAAVGRDGITANDTFQVMHHRGTQVSTSTVYRIIRDFVDHGLVSETLTRSRRALYFVTAGDRAKKKVVRLECSKTGRITAIDDADLYDRLIAAARAAGLSFEGRDIVIRA
ncbi:transcriptional repressor [Acidovorax sp. SUPP2522]|uniref:Fur family transcriptional regulator n=1 Tax=unclassified Acidovorax TaxID=2684926 RepID=UPI00234A1A64|nr:MULTISPECIES: transcriptional repressor [unclassified Acidovorax]WCM96618.1 transcriptional repressor [Acidovorax sp. GBBC 1281]GKT20084.1 transcriptional repressor [Acidovorax sp. SUPP2522]